MSFNESQISGDVLPPMVFDLSGRTLLCLSGADRLRYLNGQVSQDLKKLKAGLALPACVTSAKGRLQIPGAGRPAVLPLLGFIPAGPLEEAIQEHGEALAVEELLPCRQGDFLLRVKGDSMTGDGILDGDKVLLRPQVQVQPGEIAAVLVGGDGETTLKHVHTEEGGRTVLLRASNPAYADLRLPAESVRIAGVFRGLVRG
jgi:repressor LexA